MPPKTKIKTAKRAVANFFLELVLVEGSSGGLLFPSLIIWDWLGGGGWPDSNGVVGDLVDGRGGGGGGDGGVAFFSKGFSVPG